MNHSDIISNYDSNYYESLNPTKARANNMFVITGCGGNFKFLKLFHRVKGRYSLT